MGQTKELAEIKEFVGIVKNLDISQQAGLCILLECVNLLVQKEKKKESN